MPSPSQVRLSQGNCSNHRNLAEIDAVANRLARPGWLAASHYDVGFLGDSFRQRGCRATVSFDPVAEGRKVGLLWRLGLNQLTVLPCRRQHGNGWATAKPACATASPATLMVAPLNSWTCAL